MIVKPPHGVDGPCSDRPAVPVDVPWAGYWQALQECDVWWKRSTAGFSIFPPGKSWVGVIRKLRPTMKEDWSRFDGLHQKRVLGCAPRHDENWALLGNMFGSAIKPVFGDRAIRLSIEATVKEVIAAKESDFLRTATRAYARLTRFSGISTARATRLLTLARPDRCVSLNGGSERVLGTYAARTPTNLADLCFLLADTNLYGKLLRRIYQQPWFSRPNSGFDCPLEEEAWSMRVALLDAFIYRPKTP